MTLATKIMTFVVLLAAPPSDRASIERALDLPIQFELPGATIINACAALTRQTGVSIHFAPEALEVLPYGGETQVKATLRNVTFRDGLARFLGPLGMNYGVSDRGVEVTPHPALARIGRRAAWAELDTLRALRDANWKTPETAKLFQPRLDFRVRSPGPWTELSEALDQSGEGPADDVLSAACRRLGWTWHPQENRILVLEMEEFVRGLLERRVSLRAAHRTLVDVLQQLGRQARLAIRAEPGAIAALPLQTRENFSLLAEKVTVSEALNQVASATGLAFRVEGDGVLFYHPHSVGPQPERPTAPALTALADPYVAKVVLPAEPGGLQIEVLIRESELSPEAREARKKLIKDADDIFRLELSRRASND